MKKIVIFYATAGIGHKKAAIAIKEAFDRAGRKDVLLKDSLDYTNAFFKASYLGVYLFLVKYVPTLWGFFYYMLDLPFIYALIRPLRRLTNHLNSFKLVRFLLEAGPETVIATHFFPIEVVAALKRKGVLKTELMGVVTDYRSHKFWLSEYADFYIAGSEYSKEDLVKRGVPAEKIKPFGIPCAHGFSEEKDTGSIKRRLGISADKRTLLILSGGFGVGPVKSIVSRLDGLENDFQAVVVCGYNASLQEEIDIFAKGSKHLFKVYGFVDNVDELMAASDVLISKPGGITVTEALNSGLPMIIVQPIPGQEMRNYRFLEKHGAAVMLKSTKDMAGILKDILSTEGLRKIKENVKSIRKKNSADMIVKFVLSNE